MKTLIKISQKTFGKFKLHAISKAPNDYYSKPHTRSYSAYNQQNTRDNNREQKFIECVQAIQGLKHPFNLFKKVCNHTWYGECTADRLAEREQLRKEVHLGNDWQIASHYGYYINHETQTYAYRTCGGNAWGVYKDLSTGEYFAFYDGARSRARDLIWFLSTDELNSKPIFLESHAPSDMRWHERQADYLIRKGEAHTAKYLANTIGGKPTDRQDDGENICDAYGYFAHRNPAFDDLIFAELFKNQSPEQYLLAKFRNKKIKPESLAGKDLTAWNLLDTATQERILRWQ